MWLTAQLPRLRREGVLGWFLTGGDIAVVVRLAGLVLLSQHFLSINSLEILLRILASGFLFMALDLQLTYALWGLGSKRKPCIKREFLLNTFFFEKKKGIDARAELFIWRQEIEELLKASGQSSWSARRVHCFFCVRQSASEFWAKALRIIQFWPAVSWCSLCWNSF